MRPHPAQSDGPSGPAFPPPLASPGPPGPLGSPGSVAAGVRVFFAEATAVQRVSCGLVALGGLLLHLAMAFNWHTHTLSMRFAGSGISVESPLSFGTLLTTDLERNPIGGMPIVEEFGSHSDHTSYADVFAIFYLLLSLGLLALATGSLTARGAVQRWCRLCALATAVLSVACVVLIMTDLATLANETEKAVRADLGEGGMGFFGDLDLAVEQSLGAGSVLAVLACVLLGGAAALSSQRGAPRADRLAVPGSLEAPWQQAPGGWVPDLVTLQQGPVVFQEQQTGHHTAGFYHSAAASDDQPVWSQRETQPLAQPPYPGRNPHLDGRPSPSMDQQPPPREQPPQPPPGL